MRTTPGLNALPSINQTVWSKEMLSLATRVALVPTLADA